MTSLDRGDSKYFLKAGLTGNNSTTTIGINTLIILSRLRQHCLLASAIVDHLSQRCVNFDQLIDPSTTTIPRFITTRAASCSIKHGIDNVRKLQELTFERVRSIGFSTFQTQQANQSLSHDTQQGRRQQKRLYAHILKACYGPDSRISMKC